MEPTTNRVFLIDEFPAEKNTAFETAFQKALASAVSYSQHPIILLYTEDWRGSGSYEGEPLERLVPREVLNSRYVQQINLIPINDSKGQNDSVILHTFICAFPPCLHRSRFPCVFLSDISIVTFSFSLPFMFLTFYVCLYFFKTASCRRVLNDISSKEVLSVEPGDIRDIITTSNGDLRNAILTLQFSFSHRKRATTHKKVISMSFREDASLTAANLEFVYVLKACPFL